MMVANIIRYYTSHVPHYVNMTDAFEKEEYITMVKLNAILRLADAMDKSHRQKFKKITVLHRNNTLYVTGYTLYDIALEQGTFCACGSFFEEVFGIHPILKQKKEF